jgi:phage portal protein BeeE
MIGDLERATFSNIEHQAIEFVVHTLQPWLTCWEQAIKRDLFSGKAFETHDVGFVVAGLLRGDVASRYQAYATGRQWGWFSADDIRDFEDLNPLPEKQGETYLTPSNMQDVQPRSELCPGPHQGWHVDADGRRDRVAV